MLEVRVYSYSEIRIKKVVFLLDLKERTQVFHAGGVLAWYILCLVILFEFLTCTSLTGCHVLMLVTCLFHVLVRHLGMATGWKQIELVNICTYPVIKNPIPILVLSQVGSSRSVDWIQSDRIRNSLYKCYKIIIIMKRGFILRFSWVRFGIGHTIIHIRPKSILVFFSTTHIHPGF